MSITLFFFLFISEVGERETLVRENREIGFPSHLFFVCQQSR